MAKKLSITIGRQYGSGGREIGVRLGELLGFRVYDKELLFMAAEKQGIDADALRRVDEKATNSLLYTLALGSSLYGARNFGVDVPINDQLFITQSEIIKKAAAEENCIFIGRCADYVLREEKNILRIFVYGDLEHRQKRVLQRHPELKSSQVIDAISKTDKRRSTYYNFYTGNKWGKFDNYDLTINSSTMGIEGTANLIIDVAKKRM